MTSAMGGCDGLGTASRESGGWGRTAYQRAGQKGVLWSKGSGAARAAGWLLSQQFNRSELFSYRLNIT